jgi:hypothetical protein
LQDLGCIVQPWLYVLDLLGFIEDLLLFDHFKEYGLDEEGFRDKKEKPSEPKRLFY